MMAPRPREATAPAASPGGLSRRRFLALLGTAVASAAVPACAVGRQQSGRRPGEKAQLVYQDWRTDWFPRMVREQLDVFHQQHPNIRVYYTPDPENLEEKMLADMQAGTAADVFQGCCAHFPIWAQKGYTLDLAPYVRADLDRETIDDWDEAQYRSFFTADGHQFGLPKYHGALALYFNRNLFDRHMIDYPDESWDYEDYRQAMRRLTHDTDGDGKVDLWGSTFDVSWDRVQMYVNGWGGHYVDPADATLCRMGDPPALAGIQWLHDLIWRDRAMARVSDLNRMGTSQAFIAGRVAMVEDGSWALKSILSAAPFRVGVAPYPAGPVRRVTLASTDGFGIYVGTRHPDAAWELVKFLISADYGRAMARANFLQPARASLVQEWIGFIKQQYPDKARDMDLAAFADGHVKGYSVTAEIFANMDDAQRLAYAAWDKILTLGQAPVEYLKEVCQQIQRTQRAGAGGGACC